MAGRVIRASADAIRQVWADPEILLPDAAARVGMSKDTLQARAKALGLPPRKGGQREVIRPRQEAQFKALWSAGVAAREIAGHFGCSYFAVVNTAARLGLTMRGAGYRPRMTLAQFVEGRVVAAMAIAAKAENAALAAQKARV